MRKLRVLDLFSGIAGFSLGLERTGGFETVRFCEIEPFCRRLLARWWPGVPCTEDVTTAEFEEGEADVIVGGFPCQDLSNAGRRAGLSGSRSGLYRHLVRAIRVVRPLVAVLENVAALLGRGMGTVLGDLAESGYDAEWDCIPASAVGAPHQRDRVWIVAYPGGEQHQGKGDAIRRALAAGLPEALLANTDCSEPSNGNAGAIWPGAAPIDAQRCGLKVPDADSQRLEGCGVPEAAERRACADVERGGSSRWARARSGGWWATEPDVGRVAHGVPARVDRLRGLGNAVVPQIPELIGRAILAAESERAAA